MVIYHVATRKVHWLSLFLLWSFLLSGNILVWTCMLGRFAHIITRILASFVGRGTTGQYGIVVFLIGTYKYWDVREDGELGIIVSFIVIQSSSSCMHRIVPSTVLWFLVYPTLARLQWRSGMETKWYISHSNLTQEKNGYWFRKNCAWGFKKMSLGNIIAVSILEWLLGLHVQIGSKYLEIWGYSNFNVYNHHNYRHDQL